MRLRRHLVALVAALAAIAAALAVSQPQPVAAAPRTDATDAPEFERGLVPSVVTLPFLSVSVSTPTSPSPAQSFTFTGCMGTSGTACDTFDLDDDDADATLPGARTGMGLAPGTYVITQAPTANWSLTDISCSNTTTEVVDLANRQVTVDLQDGQGVFCTFANRTQSIRITQNTEPNGPQDFTFTGCATAPDCSTFTLDDDTDPTHSVRREASGLPVGSYTITQASDAGWDLTQLTCDETEAIDLAQRRVTITLQVGEAVNCTFTNRSQSITLIQDTTPDSGQDFGFTGCLGSGCGTLALDDDADPALPRSTTTRGLVPGTYTITQDDVPGHELTALSCPGETVDLGARRATITLGPRDDVTCTFSNRPIPPPLTDVQQIAVGRSHTCALLTNGQVRCWGTGGRLGDGTLESSARPVVVSNEDGSGPLTGVAQLSAGWSHTCAVLTSGEARCWGANETGQVGDGTPSELRTRPVAVVDTDGSGPLSGVTSLSAHGGAHSCAALDDGQAVCWGWNDAGQLGNGSLTDSSVPVAVHGVGGSGTLSGVASVSAGHVHSCALLTSGQARCWGLNRSRQLGDGTAVDSSVPTVVLDEEGQSPLSGIVQIAAGDFGSCARIDGGHALCWGQLSWANAETALHPVPVPGPDGVTPVEEVTELAFGYNRLCLVANSFAGCGTWADIGILPVADIGGPLHGISSISVHYGHACALTTGGHVRCWGPNPAGQLGDGTTVDRAIPVTVIAP